MAQLPKQQANDEVADDDGLPPRVLYFSTQFVDWIRTGKKTATTRVDDFIFDDGTAEKVGDLRKGDEVRALSDEEEAFAVLSIEQVETRTYGSLDDKLAKIENFKNKKALCDALGQFYKDLKHDSQLVVVYFKLVKAL